MARPTLTRHPKFKMLMALLRCPQAHAWGYLESIWETAYESGNDFVGPVALVEQLATWEGEPGALVEALVRCGAASASGTGFIEFDPTAGGYRVHDLWDHAPDYVRRRGRREQQRRTEGAEYRDRVTLPGQRPASDRSVTSQRPDSDQPLTATREVATRAPARAPSLAPTHIPTETVPEYQGGAGGASPPDSPNPEPKSAKKRAPPEPLPDLPAELDYPEMREAWKARLEERRERGSKAKLTASQVAGQFRDLVRVKALRGPEAAVECVRRAISGGYTGVVFADTDLHPERARSGTGNGGGRASPEERAASNLTAAQRAIVTDPERRRALREAEIHFDPMAEV